MRTRRLICNADDFGFTRSVTEAIAYCHSHGPITSTTLMTNTPAAEHASELSRSLPALGVGVHLNLTEGTAILPPGQVPGLVTAQGRFYNKFEQPKNLRRNRALCPQVEREFEAQIQRAFDLGIAPTHVDSHRHIATIPMVLYAMARAARRFGVTKARTTRGYYWTGPAAGPGLRLRCMLHNLRHVTRWASREVHHRLLRTRCRLQTPDRKLLPNLNLPLRKEPKQQLLAAIRNLPFGVSEISFHPCRDEDPETGDTEWFAGIRRRDFKILVDPDVLRCVEENGIERISYADL